MDSLVRIALATRIALRNSLGLLAALAFACVLVADATTGFGPHWRYPIAVLYTVAVAAVVRSRLRCHADAPGVARKDVELGTLLVVGALAAVVNLDGAVDGPTYPLMYVMFVVAAVLAHPVAAAVIIGFSVGVEAALRFVAFGESSVWHLATHGAFGALFAIVGVLVIRTEIARIRSHSRGRVKAEIERMHVAARSYRLLGAPTRPAEVATEGALSSGDDDVGRLVRSSVEEIHQAVLFALDLLRRSLGLHTAMLLWLTDTGTHLRISELATDGEDLNEGPFTLGDGILGAVAAERSIVALSGLKPSYKLPYYSRGCPVKAVAAIPVLESDNLRGVLVVDRREDTPFTDVEQDLLVSATRYMLRAIQNERVFVQLERAKVEQGKLYRAARALAAALSERDVVEASVRSAREIASFDFAAVTLYDEARQTHEIRAVSGESVEDLVGARFRHNAGLVSMVVQNRHPLPYKGQFDRNRQVVFTSRILPPPMPSILVLPLLVHERPLGTLVLGARRANAFGDAVRPTLEVLASHVAVSLANARMVKRLEELATSDGLTGLYNKRALLDMADTKLAAAHRFSRKLSVLVLDLDHFKKVNDTYGHDTGDVVLKGLAAILRKTKRATDVVARFGGEEFVVLCEETDREGAVLLAERIREELQRTTFPIPDGTLSVTCSIGVATYPEAGQDWDSLFKAADEALYVSKRSGRNRTTPWAPRRKTAA
jgi:two-component system cell cycle response regulator